VFKAYPAKLLTHGVHTDTINGVTLTVTKEDEAVTFVNAGGNAPSDVEAFWLSWKAAHSETEV
tara:strand:+ start:324 stop:512 length:189 start_codon:yes stop_codon:yes gene_type:complete